MERYNYRNSIQYNTEDNIELNGNSYQLILDLSLSDYGGRSNFYVTISAVRATVEGRVFREIFCWISSIYDAEAFNECYDMMSLFPYVADVKKQDEIMHHLFRSFIVRPAAIEEDNWVENGRFAWFKKLLPIMADRHFHQIYAKRSMVANEIIGS